MKLSGGDSELLGLPVDTLLMNSWNNTDFTNVDVRHFLIGEDTKLELGDADDENIDQKPSIDDFDLLLTATTTTTGSHHVNNLAELKPLTPFTSYTGHLSINGISGHHYHTIATAPNSARIQIETNNNSVDTTNQNNVPYYSTDHVVSSSTMDNTIDSIKSESGVLAEYVLPNMDEDLAAIIGSAMADTTVSGNRVEGDDSGDSWLNIDVWMDCQSEPQSSPTSSKPNIGNSNNNTSSNNNSNNNNNSNHNNNNINSGGGGGSNNNNHNHNHNNNSNHNNNVLCPDSLPDFVTNSHFAVAPQPSQVITFHSQMKQQQQSVQQSHHHNQQRDINTTFPHMSLLQSRLQNCPPKPADSQEIGYNIVSECPSPSSSTPYLAHSPPCHVVSTSDIGFIQVHSSTRPSPELQGSYPHTTTPSKKSRNRTKSKVASSIVYSDGNLGKEKTVHRCNICNRGFLNKSNIKVHLRTHTGEKPFRCEVCAKAFRQKAHLIKHAQIHKRVGRD